MLSLEHPSVCLYKDDRLMKVKLEKNFRGITGDWSWEIFYHNVQKNREGLAKWMKTKPEERLIMFDIIMCDDIESINIRKNGSIIIKRKEEVDWDEIIKTLNEVVEKWRLRLRF